MSQEHEYLLKERVFLNKWIYDDAEKRYYCGKDSRDNLSSTITNTEITNAIANVRQEIQSQIRSIDDVSFNSIDILARINRAETENTELKKKLKALECRVSQLEKQNKQSYNPPVKQLTKDIVKSVAASNNDTKDANSDDDFDLFGLDTQSNNKKIVSKHNKDHQDKVPIKEEEKEIAKSLVVLDVKPWDDETNMTELEKSVRGIDMDGLLWGSSKFVPVVGCIKKLQITCVVEDKVSTELLEEKICDFDNYVQSVDIVSFNKL